MWYNYEIVGVKVGTVAAHQVKRRQHRQKHLGQMVLLEEHHCIYEASKQELELQREKGYPVDITPYWKTVQAGRAGASAGGKASNSPNGGKVAGRIAVESGHLAKLRTTEHQRKAAKAAAKIVNAMRVQCPYCDHISTPGGISSHKKACKHRPT